MVQTLGYKVAVNALYWATAISAVCSKCCVVGSSSSSSKTGACTKRFIISNDEKLNNELYEKYSPMMVGKTQEEKENYLIELVSKGELTADQALMLAIREKIDLTN
jgi:hypothetical protein